MQTLKGDERKQSDQSFKLPYMMRSDKPRLQRKSETISPKKTRVRGQPYQIADRRHRNELTNKKKTSKFAIMTISNMSEKRSELESSSNDDSL